MDELACGLAPVGSRSDIGHRLWNRVAQCRLAPGGRLLLIEGYWKTGGGLHSQEIVAALPSSLTSVSVRNLSARPDLWSGEVVDERYAVIADLPANE